MSKVFISATSGDLRSMRESVKEALLTLGFMPVEQTNFPPDYRSVREMLEEKIGDCHALFHIVGMRYGTEPRERDHSLPRRSYTQLEYHVAREFGLHVYTFICSENFPYDEAPGEPEELHALQRDHRNALLSLDDAFTAVESFEDIDKRVREIKLEIELVKKAADDARRQTLRMGWAIAVGLVLLIAANLRLMHGQRQAEERQIAMDEGISGIHDIMLKGDLLSELLTEFERRNEKGSDLSKAMRFEQTIVCVATRNGIKPETLRAITLKLMRHIPETNSKRVH